MYEMFRDSDPLPRAPMNAAEIVRAAKAAGMIIPERIMYYTCSSCRLMNRSCKDFVGLQLVVINSWPDLITGQYQTGSEFPLAA